MPALNKGLGKGLDILFDDNEMNVEAAGGLKKIRLSDIEPNKKQPRKNFEGEALQNLSDSIKQHGVLSPLLVRPLTGGRYQIIAGERRWRAARLAGLTELPVIVMDIEDETTLEIALIENLQREDLNPIEEALGYKALMDEFSLTQDMVSKKVGKARSSVANSLRLLQLPQKVIDMLRQGEIQTGHAKAILSCDSEGVMIKLAELIAAQGLNVRKAEALAKKMAEEPSLPRESQMVFNYLASFEKNLSAQLSRKVKLHAGKSGKGKLEIEYYSNDDLDALLKSLGLYTEE